MGKQATLYSIQQVFNPNLDAYENTGLKCSVSTTMTYLIPFPVKKMQKPKHNKRHRGASCKGQIHSYTCPRKQVEYYEEELLSYQIDKEKISNSYGDDADYNISSDEEHVSSQSRVLKTRTRMKKNKNSAVTSSQQWKARKLKSFSSYETRYGCPSETEHIIDRPRFDILTSYLSV